MPFDQGFSGVEIWPGAAGSILNTKLSGMNSHSYRLMKKKYVIGLDSSYMKPCMVLTKKEL
jgi:hypothetical protein